MSMPDDKKHMEIFSVHRTKTAQRKAGSGPLFISWVIRKEPRF